MIEFMCKHLATLFLWITCHASGRLAKRCMGIHWRFHNAYMSRITARRQAQEIETLMSVYSPEDFEQSLFCFECGGYTMEYNDMIASGKQVLAVYRCRLCGKYTSEAII